MKMGKQGYTLIELMIALAVAGIVTATIYTTYKSQQDSYIAQEEVAVMQQNLRAAMFYLEREVRLAGCDPSEIAGSAFTSATPESLSFTMDITGGQNDGYDNDHDDQVDEEDERSFCDGDVDDEGENITYSFANPTLSRNDGITDSPVATNIDALNFVYFGKDISTPLPTPIDLGGIRAVQITVLVRSDRADRKILNDEVYKNLRGDIIFSKAGAPDNFRRRLLTTTIKCRNFGM